MTLLDAARRILQDRPVSGIGLCYYCGLNKQDELHTPDCPWLMMPRIVAALEAASSLLEATRLIQGHHQQTGERVGGGSYSYCADCDQPWPCQVAQLAEAEDALWRVLDPDAYREHEVYHQYLAYVREQSDRGVTVTHLSQLPGESRTAWFTRMLIAAGEEPA